MTLRSCWAPGAVRSNMDLLRAAREANPNAVLIYKPHPDVEAGLREGKIDATVLADVVVAPTQIPALIADPSAGGLDNDLAFGVRSLVRRVKRDNPWRAFLCRVGPDHRSWDIVPARRGAQDRHCNGVGSRCTLIDYPRYLDPVTGQALPCRGSG